MGRRPERSEGCLAIARQDGIGDFFETSPSFPSYTWIAIIKYERGCEDEFSRTRHSCLKELEFRYNFRANLDERLSKVLVEIK